MIPQEALRLATGAVTTRAAGSRPLTQRASATLPRVDLPPSANRPPDLDAADTQALVGRRRAPEDEAFDRPPPAPRAVPATPRRPRRPDPGTGPPGCRATAAGPCSSSPRSWSWSPPHSGSWRRRRRPRLAASLLSSEVIWGLLAVQALFLASRLIAVGSSLFDRPCRGPAGATCCRSAVLLASYRPAGVRRLRDRGRRETADAIFVEPVAGGRVPVREARA